MNFPKRSIMAAVCCFTVKKEEKRIIKPKNNNGISKNEPMIKCLKLATEFTKDFVDMLQFLQICYKSIFIPLKYMLLNMGLLS